MGAVIAIKTSLVGTDQAKRVAGMQDLGAAVITETSNAADDKDYAEGLAKALYSIVSDTDNYQVLYSYVDSGGIETSHQMTNAQQVGSSANVKCELDGTNRDLMLKVGVDSREATAFNMDAVFPEPADRENYDYLVDVAGDLGAANTAEAQKYLATFKFLSRCF